MDVYNDSNEKIGDITDVVIDSSGKVEAVVIGVGGFLGIGQRNVGVPFGALRFEMNNERTASTAAGGAANRDAAAANSNAGGVPRDNAVGSAAPATGGSAGNPAAGGAGGHHEHCPCSGQERLGHRQQHKAAASSVGRGNEGAAPERASMDGERQRRKARRCWLRW